MAMEKNKVKFGLNKVHYAKITSYDEEGVPTFAKPVRIPGAVSLSIDAEGEDRRCSERPIRRFLRPIRILRQS